MSLPLFQGVRLVAANRYASLSGMVVLLVTEAKELAIAKHRRGLKDVRFQTPRSYARHRRGLGLSRMTQAVLARTSFENRELRWFDGDRK